MARTIHTQISTETAIKLEEVVAKKKTSVYKYLQSLIENDIKQTEVAPTRPLPEKVIKLNG